jgi:acetyl esterase/lipase
MIQGRVLDLFLPGKISLETAIFFIHGGGWRGGSRVIFHPIIRALLDMGFICGSTDYRLSGTHIGDQVMDVRHGYAIFMRKLAELGRPRRVMVVGSSAGAHLALLLAMALPGECEDELAYGDIDLHQEEWIVPAGAAVQAAPVRFEPWDEIFPGSLEAMQEIVGKPYDQSPQLYQRVSPLRHIRHTTPPVLLMEAQDEHMFPREFSEEFVRTMLQAGARAQMIVYPRAEHGFFYDVTRPVQKKAFNDLVEFVGTL